MTDPRMRTVLAIVIISGTAVAAPCPRDALYPAAVPWIPCPRLVIPSPCHWCPKGDVRVDVTYDAAAPADLGKAMTAALAKPWVLDSSTTKDGIVNLVAHEPHHHLWIRIAPAAKGATMHVELSDR